MADTFNKKEQEKRKQQKKKEKEQRKADRQANPKSNSLEDMMAYVDENGNLTTTPPDPNRKKKEINESDIVIGSRNIGGNEVETVRKGRVTSFNTSKGYGFIKDSQSQESVFVHISSFTTPIQEGDTVSFQIEYGPKGANAVDVKKI